MSFVSNFREIFFYFYWKFTLVESDYILQWPWKMGRNCINKQSNAVINYAIQYVHRLHTHSREFCQKTCFEASWVVFWSLFGHKKLSLTKKLFWSCIFCVHFVIVWTGCKIWSLGICRIKQLFKVWSLKETQHAWLFFSLSLLPSSFAFLTLSCIFIMGVFGSMLIVFFCLFLWAFLTEVSSFWFGLKDFFTLHS